MKSVCPQRKNGVLTGKAFLMAVLLAAVFTLPVHPNATAQDWRGIKNGHFSKGVFAPWDAIGNAGIYSGNSSSAIMWTIGGVSAAQIGAFAGVSALFSGTQLTSGSAIRQSFQSPAPFRLGLAFRATTGEWQRDPPAPQPDLLFILMNDGTNHSMYSFTADTMTDPDPYAPTVNYSENPDYRSQVFPAGQYTVAMGALDASDEWFLSNLTVDNIVVIPILPELWIEQFLPGGGVVAESSATYSVESGTSQDKNLLIRYQQPLLGMEFDPFVFWKTEFDAATYPVMVVDLALSKGFDMFVASFDLGKGFQGTGWEEVAFPVNSSRGRHRVVAYVPEERINTIGVPGPWQWKGTTSGFRIDPGNEYSRLAGGQTRLYDVRFLSANGDADGDGMNNVDEARQGRDPLDPKNKTLGEKAVELAKTVVGAPYVYGAKGWDFAPRSEGGQIYVRPEQILGIGNAYSRIEDVNNDPKNRNMQRRYGHGLDCSGLVLWSYNKAYGVDSPPLAKKSLPELPIAYENAHGQYLHCTRNLANGETPAPGDLIFFDYTQPQPDGTMDHVVLYEGNNSVVNATGRDKRVVVEWALDYAYRRFGGVHTQFRRPKNPQVDFQARVYCPVNLVVTDPEGYSINADSWVVTESEAYRAIDDELYYSEWDLNDDGELDDVVYGPTLKDGTYTIQVVPEPDADPARTYTLEIVAKESVVELAKDVPVGSIPSGGYSVRIENGEVVESIRDVGDLVTLSESNKSTTLDRQTRKLTSVSTVTITNNSVATIHAPLHLVVVADLAAGATMPEASGTTAENDYYYDLEGKLGLTALAPGQSAVVPIKFVYPSNVRIQYGLEFWGTAP